MGHRGRPPACVVCGAHAASVKRYAYVLAQLLLDIWLKMGIA
jgi:hypothetical protein